MKDGEIARHGNAHVPSERDRKTVQAMASHGIGQAEIADVLNIDEKTLRKHYRRELSIAATVANHAVAMTLYRKAIDPAMTGPSVAAAKFWLGCKANWRVSGGETDREFVPEILSKKERAAREAEAAGVGTEWGDDLMPPGLMN